MVATAPLVRAPGFVLASRVLSYISIVLCVILAGIGLSNRLRIGAVETMVSERGPALDAVNRRLSDLDFLIGPDMRARFLVIHKRLDTVEQRLNAACPPPTLPVH